MCHRGLGAGGTESQRILTTIKVLLVCCGKAVQFLTKITIMVSAALSLTLILLFGFISFFIPYVALLNHETCLPQYT